MPFNPDLNKQDQKDVFSRRMTKGFHSQICFNKLYICRNSPEGDAEFLLLYLVRNIQTMQVIDVTRKL